MLLRPLVADGKVPYGPHSQITPARQVPLSSNHRGRQKEDA
jgi:hypothetical protein